MPLPKLVAGVALCITAIIIGLFPTTSVGVFGRRAGGKRAKRDGECPLCLVPPKGEPGPHPYVPRTIELLQKNGFRCQAMPIEAKPPYDWWDFQQLVAAADKAGIDTWPVLIPPSEGGNSLPYATDYVTWFKVLAKLSLRYPHLRGVNIDDMVQGISAKTFTRDYVCELYRDKQDINSQFLAIPTVYDLDTRLADRLAGCVDGVWFTWTNLETATGYAAFLENSRLAVNGSLPHLCGRVRSLHVLAQTG